jgi:hypothetical protein
MKASVPWLYWIVVGVIILAIVLGFIWIVRTGVLENFLPNFNIVLPI